MFKQSNLFENEVLNYRSLTEFIEHKKRLTYPLDSDDVKLGTI